ncbi:hypothetical protein [Cryptosporangium aurantiacum]|uniref:Uncharacterized protein n=1 Tax=Cryptosporangium aurantiacum TaxID=134849 RepID=A0A1M7RN98_9ACTN|nr:hypothetical protein [Cryptosporangium aurantiacum]SHN47724.1 hypothetical protein SAMN05443668_12727 [Cryptosporangium aurantiacum]
MADERYGVRFPKIDGRRSSSRTGADILADSLVRVDGSLASQAREATDWRHRYVGVFAASTRVSALAKDSVSIAEHGLQSAWDRMVFRAADGVETPVSSWVRANSGAPAPGTERIDGTDTALTRLEVPYRGEVLHGVALERQLQEWVRRGIVEPGFADAVQLVVESPELLSLPDHEVVLLGAGAEMGPLECLLRWGARVVAVDVPGARVWDRIRGLASAGTLTIPVDATSGEPGIDVGSRLAELSGWLTARWGGTAVPVLGSHAYADGATHVEINLAADVLAHTLTTARQDAVLAYLHTPTDSFLVPADAVAEARERAGSTRWNGPVHRLAALTTGRRLFRPAYEETYVDDTGRTWGLSDTLVDVQGPNYALAKRLQRWRAVLRHHAGHRVSSTVAPASWTRSVTKNRVLAAAYAGASAFGVEIFRPETARALTAAKLVADTVRPLASADAHPESVFCDAAHGGLWRQPFEPRSALSVAAVIGGPKTLVTRRR